MLRLLLLTGPTASEFSRCMRGELVVGARCRTPGSDGVGLGYGSPVSDASSAGVKPIGRRSEGGGVMSRRIASNTARNWRS